jgi:hypothetical protein
MVNPPNLCSQKSDAEVAFIVVINTVLLPLLYLKKIQIKKNYRRYNIHNQRPFDLSPSLGLPPSIQTLSPLCIAAPILSLTDIGQKKTSYHSLALTRDTRMRARKKSLGQTHLFNT